jgi:hypothetical protein
MPTILKQLGQHPFLTVRQLCRVEGTSQSWVYRRLGELADRGLVGCVNPRHPGIRPRAFYYLTRKGASRLSLSRRKGRPRFLERIATVFELRNLFLSMQRAGLPVLRWQALTPSVEGVALHGAAATVDGRQLIVEWDRGERPARLYRQRLRRVAGVAARLDVGLLVVAAGEARGVAALSALAGHLDLQGPHLGVTTRAALASQGVPGAGCYVPAIAGSLSLGGFVRGLPGQRGDVELIAEGVTPRA